MSDLMSALLAFQADAPALQKDKINPAFKSKYLSLDALMEQTMPLLNKRGLLWVTMPVARPEGPTLRYRLIHAESGQEIEGDMPLMIDKQNAQGLGSAITYARRYSMLAVLGLVADEDDDGHKASNGKAKVTTPVPAKNPLLDSEALNRMLDAIKESGQQPELIFAAVGLDGPDGVTVEHAKQIKKLISA